MRALDRLLLRVTEAAETLGISRSKCYELIASGELPSIRIGQSVRVPLQDLITHIETNKKAGYGGDQGPALHLSEEVRNERTSTLLRAL